MSVLRYFFLLFAKAFVRVIFLWDIGWVGEPPYRMHGARLGMILNHTSLFDIMLFAALPNFILWEIARHGVFPGADKTLNRPMVGRLFKILSKRAVTITRKRDDTWSEFIDVIEDDSLVLIAPEGRMKRLNGLDRDGKPMTVRSGVADILNVLKTGIMIVAYTPGMHHVHAPGQRWPRLFVKVECRFEAIDIATYITSLGGTENYREFRKAVVKDLESRRDRYCV